jgi:hypothetical protein
MSWRASNLVVLYFDDVVLSDVVSRAPRNVARYRYYVRVLLVHRQLFCPTTQYALIKLEEQFSCFPGPCVPTFVDGSRRASTNQFSWDAVCSRAERAITFRLR